MVCISISAFAPGGGDATAGSLFAAAGAGLAGIAAAVVLVVRSNLGCVLATCSCHGGRSGCGGWLSRSRRRVASGELRLVGGVGCDEAVTRLWTGVILCCTLVGEIQIYQSIESLVTEAEK